MTDTHRTEDRVCPQCEQAIAEEHDPYANRVTDLLGQLKEFYELSDAIAWIASEQSLLGDRRPADLLHTEEGTREVKAVVARLRDGAFI